MKKLSRADLIRALEKAEQNPRDLGGRIGESLILTTAGTGWAAFVSTVLTTTATTSVTAPVLGSTILGNLLGATATVTTVVAAPVWAIVAGGAGGILVTQGILRLVRSGARNDKIREDYVSALREKIAACEDTLATTGNIDLKLSQSKLAGVYATLLKLDEVTTVEVESLFNSQVLEAEKIKTATAKAKRILSNYDRNEERLS